MITSQEQFQLSRYVVSSDTFTEGGRGPAQRLLYSTRSCQLLRVSEVVWTALRQGRYQSLPPEMVSLMRDFLLLVPCDEDELSAVLAENAQAIDESDDLYLVLQPTAACQLGCDYCGQLHTPRLLSGAHQADLLRRIRRQLSNRAYRSMTIGWFGAEPLLGMSVIRSLSPALKALDSGFVSRS